MISNRTVRFLLLTGVAMAATIAGSTTPAVAPKATGEIIGIVEMGSNRVPDAVVSLTDVQGSFAPPSEPVIMDQKNKEFEPHVLAILKGSTVRFKNSDNFLHNVFSNSRVKMFNVSQVKQGDATNMTFDKSGIIPIRCHIHASMKAYIVVLPNPYFDVTNEKGLFHIGDVPAGTYTLKVWSDHSSPTTQTVEVPAGGRAKVILKVSE